MKEGDAKVEEKVEGEEKNKGEKEGIEGEQS